jgi:hypothetical protein
MTESNSITTNLTERERDFIARALYEWHGSASWTPLPIEALGLSDWDEFDNLTERLENAVKSGEPLTDLDWARTLFLTEICWASNLVGSGLDFSIVTGIDDAEAVTLLRSIQRKVSSSRRADLLFPGRGRPRPQEEWRRQSEDWKTRQRGGDDTAG